MEELLEADILWPDTGRGHGDEAGGDTESWRRAGGSGPAQRKPSRPVSIPSVEANKGSRKSGRSWTPSTFINYDGGDDEDDDYRRRDGNHTAHDRGSEKTVFSACVGSGRTLKGRDLKLLRNCVLKMTGFLER